MSFKLTDVKEHDLILEELIVYFPPPKRNRLVLQMKLKPALVQELGLMKELG